MRMGCFATSWLGRSFCGCKQWDIKGDGRTGLVVKKCVIIDSNQHGVSMENGKEDRKSKSFCFLHYAGS
jgi:hypothetical protein